MSDPVRWLQLALIGVLLFAGLALIALSQRPNWKAVTGGGRPTRVAVRRALGTVLLTASLALALWRDGPAFGSLLWFVAVQAAGVAVALTLALSPGLLRPLAR